MADEKPKLKLSKSGEGDAASEAQKPKPPTITDPMSLRDTDTSRLKRIKPQSTVSVSKSGESDEFGTETVHLKVIKEKKKQLAGILSASQTIRLRPSSGEAAPAKPAAAPAGGTVKLQTPATPAEAPSTTRLKRKAPVTGGTAKATLKLKAPTAAAAAPAAPDAETISSPAIESAPTGRLKRPGGEASKSTLKLKAPAAIPTGGGGSTLKIKAPAATGGETVAATAAGAAAPTGKATLKLKAPATVAAGDAPTADDAAPAGKSKATLRLKAPTGGQPTGEAAKSSTLRIKAPAPDGAVPTQEAAAAPASAPTVKQEAPKPGRTLKLRTKPKSAEAPAAPAAPSAPSAAALPQQTVAKQATETIGWGVTLMNVATFVLTCGTAYLVITQYQQLFGQ